MADTQSQHIKYNGSYAEKLLIWEKVLPMPPSVNNLYSYSRTRGPYLQSEVVKFRQNVQQLLGPLRWTPYKGRVAVDVFVTAKDNARRDMDNLSKCLLDSLTKAGVFADDSQIDDVRIRRAQSQKDNPHVIVRMYRLNELKEFEKELMIQEGFYQIYQKEINCGKEKESIQICPPEQEL